MRKTILILLFCAPLAALAWIDGQKWYQFGKWSPRIESAGEKNQHSTAQLDKIKKAAAEIVELPDGVPETIIRLNDPPPGFGRSSIETAVQEHVTKRTQGRRIVEKARIDAADLEKGINETLEHMHGADGRPHFREQDFKKLDQLLDRYKDLDVFDPLLVASARAEKAWPPLETDHPGHKLDAFFTELERWSPGAAISNLPAPDEIEDHVKAYRKYLEAHGSAKGSVAAGLVREAGDRLGLWERGGMLVQVLQNAEKDPVDQIDAIGGLVNDTAPRRFAATARAIAQKLCGQWLKAEPPDEMVMLNIGDAIEPQKFKRKDVKIKMKSGDTVPLGPPQPDEYGLKREQIDSFQLESGEILPPTEDAKLAPLVPTKYSDAVQAFNAEAAAHRPLVAGRRAKAPRYRCGARDRPRPGRRREAERRDADRSNRSPADGRQAPRNLV